MKKWGGTFYGEHKEKTSLCDAEGGSTKTGETAFDG